MKNLIILMLLSCFSFSAIAEKAFTVIPHNPGDESPTSTQHSVLDHASHGRKQKRHIEGYEDGSRIESGSQGLVLHKPKHLEGYGNGRRIEAGSQHLILKD